jgi:hypothetical protein
LRSAAQFQRERLLNADSRSARLTQSALGGVDPKLDPR